MEAGNAVRKAKPGTELKAIIEHYLSPEHCANRGAGCPIAALSSEIARYPRAVRIEIDRAMQRRIKRLAGFFAGKTWKQRERNCRVLMSGMVGALNLARAAVDQKSRKAILTPRRSFISKHFSGIVTPKSNARSELR